MNNNQLHTTHPPRNLAAVSSSPQDIARLPSAVTESTGRPGRAKHAPIAPGIAYPIAAAGVEQSRETAVQQEECTALKTGIDSSCDRGLELPPSTIERVGSNNISQSEVDWVI